jgi:hypothetical protein
MTGVCNTGSVSGPMSIYWEARKGYFRSSRLAGFPIRLAMTTSAKWLLGFPGLAFGVIGMLT